MLLLGGMAASAAVNHVVSMHYEVDDVKHYTQKGTSFHAAFPREARFVLMLKFADGSVRPAREEIQYLKRNRYRVDLAISDHTNCLVSPTAGPDRGYVVDVQPDAQEGRKGGSAAFSATLVQIQEGKGEETVAIAPCVYTWDPAVVRRYKLSVSVKSYLKYFALNPPRFVPADYRDLTLPKGIRYIDVLPGLIPFAPGTSKLTLFQTDGWQISESEHQQSNDFIFEIDGGEISVPGSPSEKFKIIYSDAWWKYARVGGKYSDYGMPVLTMDENLWKRICSQEMVRYDMKHDYHKCLTVSAKIGGLVNYAGNRKFPIVLPVSAVAEADILSTCNDAWTRDAEIQGLLDQILSMVDLPKIVDKSLKMIDLINMFIQDKEGSCRKKEHDILSAVAAETIKVSVDNQGMPVMSMTDSYFYSDLPPVRASSGDHPYDQEKDRLELRLSVTLTEIDEQGNAIGSSQILNNNDITLK